MRRITAISPTKRRGGGFVVQVDDRTVATLSERSVAELRLVVDRAWDAELAEQVARAQKFDRAYEAALSRLNRRALSRRQLGDRLRQLGHDQAVVAQVLDRLEALHLLDDEVLGRELIRQTLAGDPAGPPLLRSKLMQRGLKGPLIDRLLSEAAPAPGGLVRGASALAQKKLPTLARLGPVARKRRLWALLARRGFDHDTIEAALQDLAELDQNTDPAAPW